MSTERAAEITTLISIGELARRSGVASSALRFYEERGLIQSIRPVALESGKPRSSRRMYAKDVLRRVSFIRVAQIVGLSLDEIQQALATLPQQRTPGKQDWERLSRSWQPLIQERIDTLTKLRDQLSSCIGCGCLSLKSCALYNPGDLAGLRGSGARYLMGDSSKTVLAENRIKKK
ncbi:redox-sensitive transcriptional activator SoxR [Solimicrobium silvestre]|nr:redox-sensitive transcriptional activator SoxR [Solimicrobium silvestre]